MDRLGDRKRAREGEEEAPAAGKKRGLQLAEEDAAVVALFEEASATAAALTAADGAGGGEGASWVRPAGVFDLPWQKCRNGLGGGGGWELRDVFFRSLVDGRAAAIGIPGDRLFSPPSKLTLFEDLEAWLAGAGDDEVWTRSSAPFSRGPSPPHEASVPSRQVPRGPTWRPDSGPTASAARLQLY